MEPYHLVAYHGNWYLLALNAAAGRIEPRSIPLSLNRRGRAALRTPVGFHAPAFFKDALGISQADKPWNVRLLFAREVATSIRERVWHASQELRERRDGALEFRLQTSSRKELTRWILSWMPRRPGARSARTPGSCAATKREGLARCG